MSEDDRARRTTAPRMSRANATDDLRGETGAPHLDEILGGGFPRGSLVLIVGPAGSGKTTLSTQIATHAALNGKTTLILMALSESTNKLLAHLGAFTFFDHELIGGPMRILSLYSTLGQRPETISDAVIAETRRVKADLVLLDGFRGMLNAEQDPVSARQFLYIVSTTLNALDATSIITCDIDPRTSRAFLESTTADTIIGLYSQLNGSRHVRGIEIIKARSGSPQMGMHTLTLGSDGAYIYPQLEARAIPIASPVANRPADAAPSTRPRARFGLPEFDAMLRGGLPEGSCALLTGSPGAGKTLLALWYALAGVRAGERVVFLSLRESREQLLQAAEAFAIGPELAHASQPGGGLTLMEASPIGLNVDILADRLLHALDSTGAQRLVIDSVAEIERAMLRSEDPGRLDDYLAALLSAARSRRVTALLIRQAGKILTAPRDLGTDALSTLADNAIALQQIAVDGELRRVISVLKLRGSDHDTAPREVRISAPGGVQALEPSAPLAAALAELGDERVQLARLPRRPRRLGTGAGGERP